MNRFEPYSRRRLRSNFDLWARRNVEVVVLASLGVALLIAFSSLVLMTVFPNAGRMGSYLLGVVHAGLLAAYLHLLHSAFMAHDREAIWHLRGAWGEDNTRDLLRRAKRKRLIWGWVDSISLQAGDIDHLVVTRRGGLVAIDSKWRNQHTNGDLTNMAAAARRARLRAEGLARSLLQGERGRHRGTTNPLTVRPVVVVWGAAQHDVPDAAVVDGIEFVGGRRLIAWLSQLEGQAVSKDAARDVLRRLGGFRETSGADSQRAPRR